MEQGLALNLSQHLAMTPEMQQSIKILQLSAPELRSLIEEEYLNNPALELEYDDALTPILPQGELSSVMDYFRESYEGSGVREEKEAPEVRAPVYSLAEELREQAEFAFAREDVRSRTIASFIIGSLDSRGYLAASVEDIARSLRVYAGDVRAVLARVQEFEPAGIAARDLAECLRLQARARGIYGGLLAAIIEKHLARLASGELKAIAAAEEVPLKEVEGAAAMLRTLNPKPGSAYGEEAAAFISPDVFVERVGGRLTVRLADGFLPRVYIAGAYKKAAYADEEAQKYIRGRLNSALWLIKSIEERRSTIKKVAEEIVRVQEKFFLKGKDYLAPLTMREIAGRLELHESTVSRAVAGKYLEFPGGVLPLRSFFAVSAVKSGDMLSGEIKAELKALILAEDPQKPLSDQKLAALLKEKKMTISRRTVMKYREELGFPAAFKRKKT